ncbi:sulfite exporter TauE/SafE family protein [Evansella sp. AB-P1]|uniref:sulfite exporter TauE/SafE family protein n=1 Tax=Evansella sp. AB-P1 TaxID=3037653 RepID=UPI00241F092F|nr:sulfite exporter TauE/SafE family protein [Evansella sp. AB-P1]MDG5789381.1 sulfite exporter TauE/SafE family protein [Evansella sp. AB-P1]
MTNMTLLFILLLCSASIAGILKNGFGIGAGAILTPVLSYFLSPTVAVALITPILLVTNIDGVRNYWKEWNTDIVVRIIPYAVVGTLLGIGVLTFIDGDIIKKIIGALALFYATWKMTSILSGKFKGNFNSMNISWFQRIGGAMLGVIGAIANAGGIVLTVILNQCKLPKRQFMGTLMLLLAILDFIKLSSFITLGALEFEYWRLVLFSLPLVILGGVFGNLLNKKITQIKFEVAVNVLIMISGAALMVI